MPDDTHQPLTLRDGFATMIPSMSDEDLWTADDVMDYLEKVCHKRPARGSVIALLHHAVAMKYLELGRSTPEVGKPSQRTWLGRVPGIEPNEVLAALAERFKKARKPYQSRGATRCRTAMGTPGETWPTLIRPATTTTTWARSS